MNTVPADLPSSRKLCIHQLGAQVMSQLVVLLLKCKEQQHSTQHMLPRRLFNWHFGLCTKQYDNIQHSVTIGMTSLLPVLSELQGWVCDHGHYCWPHLPPQGGSQGPCPVPKGGQDKRSERGNWNHITEKCKWNISIQTKRERSNTLIRQTIFTTPLLL